MSKEIHEISKTAIFKGKEIRKTIHKNELWFAIYDIIMALIDSANPKEYIKKMRKRDSFLSEGANCHPLSIETPGGIQKLNCSNF
ncbi:MAG: hypothetical protein KR126chlam6_01403 [Candidatus Anoxychlamydiales bacterium]|nr:hypothetical protein [Candidatus Anoxychlamydiales bacterium]